MKKPQNNVTDVTRVQTASLLLLLEKGMSGKTAHSSGCYGDVLLRYGRLKQNKWRT